MRLNILAKMLLFILLPALLGLGAVAVLDYRGAEKTVLHLMDEESTLVLERQKSELTNVTNLLADVLRNAATGARILNYLYADAAGQGTEEQYKAAQEQLLSVADNFPLLAEAGLINAKGIMLAHTNPKLKNASRTDRAYYQESIKGKRSVENLVSRSTNKPATIMSVPIEVKGKVLGVVFARLDTDTLSKNLTDTIKTGETGICYVYSGKGILLMHPNKSYVGDDDANTPWVKAMMTQKNGKVEYVWKDAPKLAYFGHIPEMDWFVTLSMEKRDFYDDINAVLRNTLMAAGSSGLVVAVIIILVARSIATALRSCSRVVGRVAEGELVLSPEAQTNLTQAGTRSDEIGSLARGVGRMIENIRKLFAEGEAKTAEALKATEEAHVAMDEAEKARAAAENAKREGMLAAAEQLEGIVNILSSASEQLSAQIEQSERGAAEQAARVTETATAMEEMNSTVLEVARNAGTATDMSTRTREMAATGATVVNKAVTSIQAVQTQSLALKDDMSTLDEHARSISQIMSVISDIADQTNLLALNAAIEAARAGEAGRGFAVVADEVRKLAEKTMASTTDVGNAIKSIQTSAEKSARQVDVAVQTIGEATECATQSGTALEEIVNLADSSADQVRAIATASEEQSATSEEINRSIGQVSSIANETSRAMQEAASAVSELARQAQALSRLIEEMKQG